MAFFDFLKPRSAACQSCGCTVPGVHTVNSTYLKHPAANTRRKLCTDCFLEQWRAQLRSFRGRIVFIEPIIEEGYTFTKFVDERATDTIVNPLRTFLPASGARCERCDAAAQFAWLPADAMKETGRHEYRVIYRPKDEVPEHTHLCPDHLTEELARAVRSKKFFFLEVWPPREDEDGYCS